MTTYKIVRFYKDGRKSQIKHRGLTLEQAQEHCKDRQTHKIGEWFDGYEAE